MLVARTLELLQNPSRIQKDDIGLLNQEISKYPYIQSLRALLLYATHQYNQEDYKALLSATAAYTTDKKILYQFVNQIDTNLGKVQVVDENYSGNSQTEAGFQEAADAENFTKTEIVDLDHPKAKELVKDEETISFQEVEPLNPEAEVESEDQPKENAQAESDFQEAADAENFTKTEIVDLDHPKAKEQVKDEETISFQEVEPLNPEAEVESEDQTEENSQTESDFKEAVDAENFTKTEIVDLDHPQAKEQVKDEETISFQEVEPLNPEENSEVEQTSETKSEDTLADKNAQVSFHKTDEFIAYIPSASKDAHSKSVVSATSTKADDEMKRLIAEVEAKMKAKKKEKQPSIQKHEEEVSTHADEVNFSEIQHEETPAVSGKQTVEPVEKEKNELKIDSETDDSKIQQTWKPLSLDHNEPDALLSKSQQTDDTKPESEQKEQDTISNEVKNNVQIEAEHDEERPILNVSFFSESVSPISPVENNEVLVKEESAVNSNIPSFITTWQNWLKLDKTESVIHGEVSADEEVKVEQKNKVIETFIETNPKISKLKDDTDFVVKDRSEDIMHLMTETLANLYVDQKLYTKALSAFEALIEKHPEKRAHFEERIQQIKDQKAGK